MGAETDVVQAFLTLLPEKSNLPAQALLCCDARAFKSLRSASCELPEVLQS